MIHVPPGANYSTPPSPAQTETDRALFQAQIALTDQAIDARVDRLDDLSDAEIKIIEEKIKNGASRLTRPVPFLHWTRYAWSYACWSLATSNFFICNIAFITLCACAGVPRVINSSNAVGVICHDKPN